MIENKDIAEAVERIARTEDGQLLYRYLQKTLCSISTDPSRGALREHQGRRSFAAELMGLMAKGIEDSDRHAITFAVSGARRTGPVAGSRGAGRRITADTVIAGWDIPAEPGSDPGPGTGGSDAA